MSYITYAGTVRCLVKVGGSILPFINNFPSHTGMFKLMNAKPGDG